MLSLGVESEDILLVSGPIGSGKSVALRSFIAALDPNRFSPDLPPRPRPLRCRSGQIDSSLPPRGTALQLRQGTGPVLQVRRRASPKAHRRHR
jgi:energy-coupling factor transporter ATP-binding protein EcfA2